MNVVPLYHIPHLLRRNCVGNLRNIVVMLLRSFLQFPPLLLRPRSVTQRSERYPPKGGDGGRGVAVVGAEELDGFVEEVNAGAAIGFHALDIAEEGFDCR